MFLDSFETNYLFYIPPPFFFNSEQQAHFDSYTYNVPSIVPLACFRCLPYSVTFAEFLNEFFFKFWNEFSFRFQWLGEITRIIWCSIRLYQWIWVYHFSTLPESRIEQSTTRLLNKGSGSKFILYDRWNKYEKFVSISWLF